MKEMLILAEEQVLFGGLSIMYRFFACGQGSQVQFGIRVELGDEVSEHSLGNRLLRALELYQRIKGGAVTPCSLPEVIADIVA